jgi:putative tricarboxylic transport membrane protein
MPQEVRQRTGEIVIGLALAALGIFVFVVARQMPFGTLGEPGPGVLPVTLGALLVVAGLLVAGVAWLRTPRDPVVPLGHADVVCGIAALAVVGFVFEALGAPLVLALMLTLLFKVFARTSWWRAALGGIVGSAATWLFFVRLLDVPLPAGFGN